MTHKGVTVPISRRKTIQMLNVLNLNFENEGTQIIPYATIISVAQH